MNEEGCYLGVETHPAKGWKISAYADAYRFPWLKFETYKPSSGYDLLLQTDFSPKDDIALSARFRFERKEDNVAGDSATTPTVSLYDKSSIRFVLNYSLSENLKLRNTLEANYSKKADDNPTYGYLLAQDLCYTFPSSAVTLDFRYELFDALNYENRMYCYEKDVLYAFSIPLLYGKGNRYYLNLKYKLNQKLTLYFKISQTTYNNKTVIGSDEEEIKGNRKTDVRLLIKWKI
jgi:hypothetical protein